MLSKHTASDWVELKNELKNEERAKKSMETVKLLLL